MTLGSVVSESVSGEQRAQALDTLNAALRRVFEVGLSGLSDEAKDAIEALVDEHDSRIVFRVVTSPLALACSLTGPGIEGELELFTVDTEKLPAGSGMH